MIKQNSAWKFRLLMVAIFFAGTALFSYISFRGRQEDPLVQKVGEKERSQLAYKASIGDLLKRGKIFKQTGQWPEAQAVYQEIIRLDPSHVDAREELAWVYAFQRQYPEALKILEQLTAEFPRNTEYWSAMAHVYLWMGDNTRAYKTFGYLYRQVPHRRDIAVKVASLLEQEGDLKNSLHFYSEATRLRWWEKIGLRLGYDYPWINHYQRGLQGAIRVAHKLNPLATREGATAATAGNTFSTALEFIKKKDYEQAIPLLEEIQKRRPEDTENMMLLSQVYGWAGEFQQGLELLQRLLSKHPDHRDARLQKAFFLCVLQRSPEGLAEYRQLLQEKPDDAVALLGYGKALSWAERYKEAHEILNKGLALEPKNIEILLALGNLSRWQNQTVEAENYFKQVLTLDPLQPEALGEMRKLERLKVQR